MATEPSGAAAPDKGRKDTGTSLSNALFNSNASLATISFQPRAAMSARLAEAPVFVPRGAAAAAAAATSAPPTSAPPPAAPSSAAAAPPMPTMGSSAAAAASAPPLPASAAPYDAFAYAPYESTPFETEERAPRNPLQYHLYAPPFPHVSNFHPTHLAAMTFFMDPALHEELQRKQEALYATGTHDPSTSEALPDSLHVYHDLVALEPGAGALPHALVNVRFPAKHGLTGAAGDPSRVFGYRTHTYKATCALDGKCYVLRRVENFPLQLPMAISAAERWRKIRHPSIVAVREAFTTRAFGDPCACD